MVEPQYESRIFQNIIDKIVGDNFHISTGVIGTSWLMRELTKRGRADVAYALATQKTYPSWGYMVESGATTIWELWNGDKANPSMNSHNHIMLLGDLLWWVYEDLAGIKTHPDHRGFKQLWMKPHPTRDLTFVNASYKTPEGLVKSYWNMNGDLFTWYVTVPKDVIADVLIPARSIDDVIINGRSISQVPNVKYVGVTENRIHLQIGSGNFVFICPYGEVPGRWESGIVKSAIVNENPTYPESHASTIVETTDGTLAAAWFGGTKEKNPDVEIWFSRFENGQWQPAVSVANGIINETLRYPCWNPVLYQIPNGVLQLYYKMGADVVNWKGKLITSRDGGKTWSQPVDLPEGILGPIKNKPILLKDGTLLYPTSWESRAEGFEDWRVYFESSRNFGRTFSKTGFLNDGKEMKAIQPTLLVYKNGDIQMLSRSNLRYMAESWSKDNGKTWSPMTLSMLPQNNSGFDGVTLQDGRQLLVYNHVFPHEDLPRGKGLIRSPLNVAVSDDGKTWYATNMLENSPFRNFGYPSVIQTKDGLVHIVYTWDRQHIKHVVIDPKKLILTEIKDAKWQY
jgi:alpha-L-rhamnosidase